MLSFQQEELMRAIEQRTGIWRLSLEQIEATVADHLGRGRVQGNRTGPCFSRQISMYLAKNVGGWSTTRIGRFYNRRHHTTVLHAIQKIERLRRTDESVDASIEVLTAVLSPSMEGRFSERFEPGWSTVLIIRSVCNVHTEPDGIEFDPSSIKAARINTSHRSSINALPHEGLGDSNEAKRRVRSLDRALPRRDITVPTGTSIASAIS
jgi:hypothetical protein